MISTNGSLLTEGMVLELVKSDKFNIQYSFSGWDKTSYESRYVGGNFDDSIKKIGFLIETIEKAGLPKNTLKINSIVADDYEIKKTKMFLITEFGLAAYQMYIHRANNWVEVVVDSNTNIKRIKKTKEAKEIIKSTEKNDENKYHCHITNTRIGVLFDGKMTACGCLDVDGGLILGDIQSDKISDIRKNQTFKKFLNEFNKGKSSELICARCDSLKIIH